MFRSYDIQNTTQSNHFGYPHLGRPNDHFEVTPFEALYADNQTYEHIDPINSVDQGNISHLDSIRVFLRDEIEGENFYLQNKTIGKNHVQWLPNFEYQAWYKAEKELHIGHEVTPKTNKGNYVIEETGNITVYAGEKVVMKPGFHAKVESKFHAFIKEPACVTSKMSILSTNNNENTEEHINNMVTRKRLNNENQKESKKVKVYPNPNNQTMVNLHWKCLIYI
jgi:hypothetical protein